MTSRSRRGSAPTDTALPPTQLGEDPPGRRRALAVLAAAMVLSMATWFSASAVLPVLRDRWELSSTSASWLTIAMAISGTCALVIGFLRDAPLPVLIVVALIWGLAVVADSAQFSTIVTEVADQSYLGTAVTLQLAVGFVLTVATIWLVPVIRDGPGWTWAFVLLVPGPVLGTAAMLRLKSLPEADLVAGGRG